MISFNHTHEKLAIEGLSTDEKPIEEYKGYKIANGSTFYEMNTGDLYMYDEENAQWIKQ